MNRPPSLQLTKRPLLYWVTHRFRLAQLFLLGVIIVSLFFRVYPLELQRNIINIAINLKKLELLYLYCALYLGAVILAGLLKYFINAYQAIIGQKLLIQMRQELYQHILQLPLQFFHKTQAGTIISAMTAELNTIGLFLGGALTIPITALLTFLAFAGYMIYLNPLLGLISMAVYPFELVIVPMLQRRFNTINTVRVTTTRAMANVVNEAVSGIHEVQSNAGYSLEIAKQDRLTRRLYTIMRQLSLLKYGIKFSNNLFQSLGPFILFLVGGYLAIHGNFTIGALVAFLSAYEKVYDPWKEIIEYYQDYQDAQVRYSQIIETFSLEPEYLLAAPQGGPVTLSGNIRSEAVGYSPANGVSLLEDINFSLAAGQHLALVGFSGSGKSTLSLLLGQLYPYTGGSLTIDEYEVSSLTKEDISCNISVVSQQPFIFTGTVKDNLLYSCNALHLAGNLEILPSRAEIIAMVREVGLAEDILRWGLTTILPPPKVVPRAEIFLNMRRVIQAELRDKAASMVEFYDSASFLEYSSIAINLVFSNYPGSPHVGNLLANPLFQRFLTNTDLEDWLVDLGQTLARATVTFLGDFSSDPFFFQGSPMEPHQFESYAALIDKIDKKGLPRLSATERQSLLTLALLFLPDQHKIHTLSPAMKDYIVAMRQRFLEEELGLDLEKCQNGLIQQEILSIAELTHGKVDSFFTPFCVSQYLYSHSLLDNIIFGTVIEKETIESVITPLTIKEFTEQGLLDEIFEIGLEFHVGSKGDRLSGGQKQKIALTRAFLKRSPLLILDEATASLDNSSQARVQRYIETNLKGTTTLIAVVHRLDLIVGYDHILVMKAGKIVESGNYTALMASRGTLYELVNNV